MSAFAYLLPPVTGSLVYLRSGDPRARAHGLQSVLLGVLWPAGLYVGSAITPGATQVAALAGALAWLGLLLSAAVGRAPLSGWLIRLATLREP